METDGDKGTEVVERTVPEEIADLDVEVQAMFHRLASAIESLSPRPEQIGRYELRGKIGKGGMGSVYRAYDPKLRRPVAIKLVSAGSLKNPEKLRERLQQEALTLAKLDHPNIVTLFDGGVHEGRVFLAMELVEGETLRKRQDRPDCSFDERLRLYAEAGRGLAAAHGRGVVHRDFKPENVFVDEDGRARVGDFGLAHALGEDQNDDTRESEDSPAAKQRMTQTGEFLGTVGYAAPEQLHGQRSDARSDQYAFCVALWESLCGEKPYDGVSRDEQLAAMDGKPQGGEKLPKRLRRALLVGLSQQPQQRYPDMNAVIRVIERELQRPERLRRRLSLAGGALMGVAGIVALWFAYRVLNPSCPLADKFAEYPSRDEWSDFAEAKPSIAKRVEALLEIREDQARFVCVNEDPDSARAQQLRAVDRHLERLLSHSPDRYDEFAYNLENALMAGPTQPLTPDVDQFLADELEPLETDDFDPLDADALFEAVIAASTKALDERAKTPADRAELLLRRGRAHLLHADYKLAIDDFMKALWSAEGAHDDERRLQAYIEVAKTETMRFEEVENGDVWAYSARALLDAVDELGLSPRHAALDEVEATLARRKLRLGEALSLQRRALWRDVLAGRFFDLVPRFIGLGIIHESLENPHVAELCYRAALHVDPHDPEAQVNLGRLLVNVGDEPDEARELLDAVLEAGHSDTRLAAAVSALQLELQLERLAALSHRRAALLELLESGHPGTKSHISEGWYFVVIAYVMEGVFGPDFYAALNQLLPLLNEEQRAALESDLKGFERAHLLLEQTPPIP